LKVVLDAAKKYNAQTHLFNLRNSILQMYNPEATKSDDGHDNITKVRDLLNWADAFVLCPPDYHGSISGILKDFLDYTSTICLKNLWLSLRIS
jgi:azobenzene reductase